MKLQNMTMVILSRTCQGRLEVARILTNPEVPGLRGKPVVGPYARRLLSVKEVAERDALSLNKAAEKRRVQPLQCLADFPGQPALDLPPAAAEVAAVTPGPQSSQP